MMNKLTRKAAIAIAVGTMTIAATGAIAHARVPSFLVESNSQTSNEIQQIETVDVSVDDCISKSVPCYGFGGSSKRSDDEDNMTGYRLETLECDCLDWIAIG